MSDEFTLRRVQNAIDCYVEDCMSSGDHVSTQEAYRILSQAVRKHAISNRALDELVAQRALMRGLAVCFDRTAAREAAARGEA